MKTVWKYDLKFVREQRLSLPEGADALCVRLKGMEGGLPQFVLYCQVDTEVEKLPQKVFIISTGGEMPPDTDIYWLDTVAAEANGKKFIFHFYVEDTI